MTHAFFSLSLAKQKLWGQWLGWLVLYLLGMGGGLLLAWLGGYFGPGPASIDEQAWLGWLFWAGLVAGVELTILAQGLDRNRSNAQRPLRPDLGWGNRLTLSRGICYAIMAGFLFGPPLHGWLAWLPALLYLLASIADLFDGYLARRFNQTSQLGALLDMEFDGLGILVVTLLAVQFGQLPWIYLLVAVSRPLFVLGMKLRDAWDLPNYEMHPSINRRLTAGIHMGFMAVVIWPVFQPPATHLAGAIFGGALLLSFARDWLVVIGWIRADHPNYQRWRYLGKRAAFGGLPLLLRAGATGMGAWVMGGMVLSGAGGQDPWLAGGVLGLGAVSILATGLGVANRSAGIGLIGFACGHLLWFGQGWANLLLLALGSFLIFVGGGPFSLWRAEDRFFRQPLGSPTASPAEHDAIPQRAAD